MADRTYEEWLTLSKRRYRGGPHPVDLQAYKQRGHALAERLGIPHARILAPFRYLRDVDFAALPKRFAIHLGRGCSNVAVWLLERRAGRYHNLFDGHDYDYATLAQAVEKQNAVPPPVPPYLPGGWIEELFWPIPDNVKVWCFGQTPGLIARWTGADPRRIRFWDGQWRDIGDCRVQEGAHMTAFPYDATLPVPEDRDGLLDIAKRVQAAIGHPFIRVDLYDTSRGLCWGEVTPHPGGGIGRFNAETDSRLGQLWTEAGGIPALERE